MIEKPLYKISNFKKVKVPREYHAGHWAGNTWIRGYYTGEYSYTKYKVTVTLNKTKKESRSSTLFSCIREFFMLQCIRV